MNANEMAFNFLIKYDKIASLRGPGYEDRELSYFANAAQDKVFLRKYDYFNKGRGFEFDERRRRELAELIKDASISGLGISLSASQGGVHPNGYFYDLPSLYLYTVEESVKLVGASVFIRVRPITHDYYIANLYNPYRNPNSTVVWRLEYSRQSPGTGEETGGNAPTAKRVELITDGTAITDYRVRYIKYPRRIVVDQATPANQISCELDDSVHEEIVDEMARIAVGITDPQLYQIRDAEVSKNE